jgi:DNA modification methylase
MRNKNIDMFGEVSEKPTANNMSVIPVSVIDLFSQNVRDSENHDGVSSRANYSPFPTEITNLCYELYLRNSTSIFDPFAGWGERHAGALRYGKQYTGYDISDEAIEKACNDFGVVNLLADSADTPPPNFDGLITCPPYWNLETYQNLSGIDRCKTWDDFLYRLYAIFSTAYEAADEGAIFCVMSGDWRKDHKYYDLTYQIDAMFNDLGAKVVDKVTVSRKKISKIKIMLPQAKRLGYSVRVHESLHVYTKPVELFG